MEQYKPVTRVIKHDTQDRTDQETWNLVGNDPTILRLRGSVPDVTYHLGDKAEEVFFRFISLYEEQLYDRLNYN